MPDIRIKTVEKDLLIDVLTMVLGSMHCDAGIEPYEEDILREFITYLEGQ